MQWISKNGRQERHSRSGRRLGAPGRANRQGMRCGCRTLVCDGMRLREDIRSHALDLIGGTAQTEAGTTERRHRAVWIWIWASD